VSKEFSCIPLTLKKANEFVEKHHRHNKKCQGHRFSLGILYYNELVGVAICGRPLARKIDQELTLEVLRVCIKEPSPKNACSFIYGKCWSIWKKMGGKKIITYTLATESGSSMKAVGWKKVSETKPFKEGKGWTTRKNRIWQPVNSILKYRWENAAN
jgi:hypothetical protein|tara:strand:- start:613 stop:1083 length:471 start_codon:yes stop_codon:yes gene_type:complete